MGPYIEEVFREPFHNAPLGWWQKQLALSSNADKTLAELTALYSSP
jgi:hypothetical protein